MLLRLECDVGLGEEGTIEHDDEEEFYWMIRLASWQTKRRGLLEMGTEMRRVDYCDVMSHYYDYASAAVAVGDADWPPLQRSLFEAF